MKKIGFIVNPIAGMGGRVGLKGTDGEEILRRALALGAKPIAPERGVAVLRRLLPVKEKFSLITWTGKMGEDEALEAGFSPEVMGERKEKTTAEDTKKAAGEMKKLEVDLLVFVGGDGTARDVMEVVGIEVPVLGVPAGVKMHSAVFSATPEDAAEILMRFLWDELPLREAEVMDVDEEAFRAGRISASLRGFMMVPYEPTLLQGMKLATPESEDERMRMEEIARWVVEEMERDVLYIIGPGTTTRAICEVLGEEKSLLGVDIVLNGRVVARDVGEEEILRQISGRRAKVIVTPIGGQGFIFGRGNQQIGAEVLRRVGKENVVVVATPQKLARTPVLRVDTGDPRLDGEFRGHMKVVTGYGEFRVVRVA
ncbi:MAG: ATP-NAD kinase family protein [Candidatus Hadarchaeales archaeon]